MNKFVAERLYPKIGDSNTITQNIQEGKAITEKIETLVGQNETANNTSNENIFEQVSFDNEEYTDVLLTSDEYLDHGQEEAAIFSKCTGTFDIKNPRTLVRIHNTITLLKGLYPNLIDENNELNKYIYLVFLQETYAGDSQSQRQELLKLFEDKGKNIKDIEVSAIKELGDELGVLEFGIEDISKALGRIRKLSLPGVEKILEKQTKT
jgi:hypothetical protein